MHDLRIDSCVWRSREWLRYVDSLCEAGRRGEQKLQQRQAGGESHTGCLRCFSRCSHPITAQPDTTVFIDAGTRQRDRHVLETSSIFPQPSNHSWCRASRRFLAQEEISLTISPQKGAWTDQVVSKRPIPSSQGSPCKPRRLDQNLNDRLDVIPA